MREEVQRGEKTSDLEPIHSALAGAAITLLGIPTLELGRSDG